MPDVTRSDSQRSDASLRPRVSFNRDVHVKRIVPNETSRVTGALGGNGADNLITSPVRKERLPKSKQQLAEEAAKVLHQVDKLNRVAKDQGTHPDKFYTLPARRKNKIINDSPQSSVDRKTGRRKSEEFDVTVEYPPKKPPRTFVHYPKSEKSQRTSLFNIFKKAEREPQDLSKKSNLRRSVSDATNLKSKVFGPPDDNKKSYIDDDATNVKANKKQLSPIIETTQRDDYFSHYDKENIDTSKGTKHVDQIQVSNRKNKSESVTEQLKEYIDEVDTALFNETGIVINHSEVEKKIPEIIVIDVDKAEKISRKKDKSKLNTGAISKKFKSLGNKKEKTKQFKNKTKETVPTTSKTREVLKNKNNLENTNGDQIKIPDASSSKIKKALTNLRQEPNSRPPKMIHSSQKPVEKLPLTRGLKVDTMVKRLNNDKTSPSPPKTNVMVTPNVSVQHNNNQPFSYTRGLSPERNYRSPERSRSPPNPGTPVIYAHVVCDKSTGNNSTSTKQTVHAAYTNGKKHLPHSDSDEGLGNEESLGYNRTKYELEKNMTHFGDDRNLFNDSRIGDDYPITPKFKNMGYDGFNNLDGYTKTEHNIFIDSSSRGRGDGMDSKRRESLTERHENGFSSLKYHTNSRTDLSTRRDLLESRINKRLGDKSYQHSPPLHANSKYISETTAKYYRQGSSSPVGYAEAHATEIVTDKSGNRHISESHTRKHIGDSEHNRYKNSEHRHHSYDNEPKSFDSQVSDYRSSPENVAVARRIDASHDYKYSHSNKYMSKNEKNKLIKNREHYKSNPEITHANHESSHKFRDSDRYQETYHDSLKRERNEYRTSTAPKHRPERYFNRNDSERKDKLGDSGIENDFKRESREQFRTPRSSTQRREYCNDSEDEGFASSLLIASERQHTEENINNNKLRHDYDSDRGYRDDRDVERDDPYRNIEHMEYKTKKEYKSRERHEYAPRERSIDDGSHYDPRIDKDLDIDRTTLKKRVDKKPPKPEKKSSLEKVKQLFSRDSKKNKKEKEQRAMVTEENLRSRYAEYKGSRENLEPRAVRKNVNEVMTNYEHGNRRRLSTPSPSPIPEPRQNGKSRNSDNNSWFKSLDRFSRKKSKKEDKELTSEEETPIPKPTPTKNLRFFGDTDIESNDSLRHKPIKTRSSLANPTYQEYPRSQSSRDLHYFEERRSPEFITPNKNSNHKSLLNISEKETDRDIKGSRINLKPPISPNHRIHRDLVRSRDDKDKRRKNEVSSVESSTEGDGSQQSQRSVVYLHAATVGDIPGPNYIRNGRRAASREELASNRSSNIRPQVKTLSRSFSVLAPWKPRHLKESHDIDYTQYPKQIKNGKYEQKATKNGNNRIENTSTLKKKANESKRTNQATSTLNRRSKSKENVSSQTLKKPKEDVTKASSSTLYKKKEKQLKENTRYNKEREDRKISTKSMSIESLGNNRSDSRTKNDSHDLSRSVSMPRDPEKSAGWFKVNKKGKKSSSTQRL